MPEQFYTVREIADRLRLTRHGVYALIRQGHFNPVRLGPTTLRIPVEQYDDFISNGGVQ